MVFLSSGWTRFELDQKTVTTYHWWLSLIQAKHLYKMLLRYFKNTTSHFKRGFFLRMDEIYKIIQYWQQDCYVSRWRDIFNWDISTKYEDTHLPIKLPQSEQVIISLTQQDLRTRNSAQNNWDTVTWLEYKLCFPFL